MRNPKLGALIWLCVCMLLFSVAAQAAPEDYNVQTPALLETDNLYGDADVCIDADTGDILFNKNARVRMYPASTTKVMTLLLAVESGWDFNTSVTIPPEADDIPADSSRIPVYKGEITTFGDLLYGLMLHSGNDGANAIAVLVSGSVPAFVEQMNQRAIELGCTGTHFANAHGYHNENHYSTALDLALITREALKHEKIRQIVATRNYTMHVSPRGEIRLNNTNSLLNPDNTYYFEDCIGVKTGTHSQAGQCFVGAAERDGVTLISVALHCGTNEQRWIDTIRLLRYGFTRYTPYSLDQMFSQVSDRFAAARVSNAKKDDEYGGVLQLKVAQVSDSSYARMIQTDNPNAMNAALDDFSQRVELHLQDNLAAPISEGEIVGGLTYYAQNGEIITATLIAGRDIEAQPKRASLDDLFPFLKTLRNPLVLLLILILILILVLLRLYFYALKQNKERRRRELYERHKRQYQQNQRQQMKVAASTRIPAKKASGRSASGRSASTQSRRKASPSGKKRQDDLFDF